MSVRHVSTRCPESTTINRSTSSVSSELPSYRRRQNARLWRQETRGFAVAALRPRRRVRCLPSPTRRLPPSWSHRATLPPSKTDWTWLTQTGRGWPGRNHERNVRQSHRLPAKLRSIDRQFMTNELNECVDWKRSSGKQRRIKNQRWKAQITLTACFLQLSLYIHCHRGINERWHRVAVVLSSQKKTSGFPYFLQSSSAFSTPVISTLAPASRVFHSCDFHPGTSLPCFPLLWFPPWHQPPAFSTPVISTLAPASRVFHSLVFHSCVFSVHEWINKK